MSTIYTKQLRTPIGILILGAHNDKLCLCDWVDRRDRAQIDRRIQRALKAEYIEGSSQVIVQAIEEINDYFQGKLHRFNMPLLPIGTPFQQAVWREIAKIPYGTTASYKEIAHCIGKPEAVRAVANAIGANALSLFIPCHRIIASDGSIGGYAGGVEVKQNLLKMESQKG